MNIPNKIYISDSRTVKFKLLDETESKATMHSVKVKIYANSTVHRLEHECFCESKKEANAKARELNEKEFDAVNPKVGTRGTVLFYTDREPVEVVKVSKSGKKVWVKTLNTEMTSKPEFTPGGFSAHCHKDAEYKILDSYKSNIECTYTLRSNGRFVREGENMKSGTPVTFHYCIKHYDYNF